MNNDDIQRCPQCHTPVPPEAPQGLCPKCLLAGAMMATEAGQAGNAPQTPSMEAVAAAFPQLEILEFIGRGGMGVVFKARQPKLDRFVALKLLTEKPGTDPAFGERFHREARVLARLNHSNIVMVHDFGQAGPFYYLLMEYVDGVNLRQAMRAGRFTPAQALTLVPRICDALQYAHEEGVLHRDIKPENLLLDARGRVKIADFGIAKLVGDTSDITLTARGASVGTPHYMAPEQLERPQDVDHRADVYSLGVVFYEMLTGELPLGRFAPPSEKAPMDPRLDQVVLRSLEKERERRFQSAGDVKTQVEQISAQPPVIPASAGGAKTVQTPPVLPSQPGAGAAASPGSFRWSIRALGGAGLVGLSLLVLAASAGSHGHMGPGGVFMIGLLAAVGTVLSGFALRALRDAPQTRRGARLALLSTVAWPLVLLSVGTVMFAVLLAEVFQWHVFGSLHGVIVALGAAVGFLAVLLADSLALKYWFARWRKDRELPHSGAIAFLSRFPKRSLWFTGAGLAGFWLVLLADHAAINRRFRNVEAPPMAVQPIAPQGFDVPEGAPPSDDREYRSTMTIPAGYALTVSTVLCSNQVVLREGMRSVTATMKADQGHPVEGQVTWRLLGNSTFGDGAPLRLAFSLAGKDEQIVHVVPPERITIDWVGVPTHLWPPQNGHTKFLLVKGFAENSTPDAPIVEWGLGVETRLDPISGSSAKDVPTSEVSTNTSSETSAETPQSQP